MSSPVSTTRAATSSRAVAWLAAIALAGGVIGWFASRRPAPSPPPAPAPASPASRSTDPGKTAALDSSAAAPDDRHILTHATKEDLMDALRKRIAAGASTDELAATFVFLARTRPELALELTASLARDSDERYVWSAAVLKQWTEADPAAAWTWTLSPINRRDMSGDPPLPAVVLTRAATADPKRVVSLVDALMRDSGGLTRADLNVEEIAISGVHALLQTGNSQLARESVEQWLNGTDRVLIGNGAIELVSQHLVQESPQAAADWLSALPVSEARDYALATFAADWSATAPQAAMEWAAKLDTIEARSQAMQRTFNRWAEKDLVAAAAWLGENESDPTADRLIANLVADSNISATNPALAAQWAGLINDPALRLHGIEQTVLQWRNQDAAAAERFITENRDLSAAEKAALLKTMRAPSTPSRE